MVKNYMGLYWVYKDKEDYRMANEYLSKRYDLRDSLMDYKVKEQVATLESRIIIQKNEIAQERNKNELLTIKNRNRILGILAVIFALTGIALYLYYRHRQIFLQTKIEENEENIKVFIQTLIRKNAMDKIS
ncbi:MAG: hypothetical protein IPO37_22120 [Saprospiraceae bacterium]|nr:hypothetical protein [Saprospiraceae bacterium]